MSNQMMAKVIVSVGVLLVLALGGCSQVSDSVLTTGAPSFPTGLHASPGNGQVVLTWNAVDGATSYNVYWATVSGVNAATGNRISNIAVPATSYVHTNVTNGVLYYYVVTALTKTAESLESEQVSAMPAANLGAWIAKSPLSLEREFAASSVVNNSIYVIDGFSTATGAVLSSVEVYNPTTNSWTTQPSSPGNPARVRAAASLFNGNIYVIGGGDSSFNVTNTVTQYNPGANSWTQKATMSKARSGLTSSATNTLIYAMGGYDGFSTLNTVEAYDPTANSWTTKTSMATARYLATSALVNDKIYVIGGTSSTASSPTIITLNTVESYDPATNSWTPKAAMPTAREGMTSGVVNGKIYVIGGFNENFGVVNTVEVYDPTTDSWSSGEAMPSARTGLPSGVVNNIIYAIGGYDGFVDLKTVEQFTP